MTRIWARCGTRPRAPRDTRYKWSYIFGAACPARGTTAGLILPRVDTEAMSLHLQEIAKTVADGILEYFNGIYMMTPFNRYSMTVALTKHVTGK